MAKLCIRAVLAVLAALAAPAAPAAPAAAPLGDWAYLPAADIGAAAFKRAHPTWDGRGVVIAILDTGVDAFAPGLERTTTGQTKLLEALDLTPQGDWETVEAEIDSTEAPATPAAPLYRHPDGHRLRGAERLAVPPRLRPVYITRICEAAFINSNGLHDLNDDGDTDDTFGVLVYQAERAEVEAALGGGRGYELLAGLSEQARRTVARERESARVWLVAVDRDGDGRLDDERPLRDYRVDHDLFRLTAPDAPEARTLMAWSVNVVEQPDRLGRPRAPKLSLHFDDGAHGSHCAGIAAGHRVGGQEGLDGVAPGAWLISLKLGDNTLSGGATRTESMKQAAERAAAFAEDYGVPVVVNMSYGVASVQEGDDAMGRFLDELLAKNPRLFFCTSAGNEGPGVSTVGLPATASSVIASGAYLSPAVGADLYNARLSGPTLFAFSSRGGDAPKPDVVAPGAALSTVPGWNDGTARFNGTSMASPTTAGGVACLLSAAQQEGLQVHWGMVKRALIAGGRELPGLLRCEQGGGLVDLERSWELLRQLARSRSARQVLDWRVETAAPHQDDGLAGAAYWRTPGGVPLAPEVVTFRVTPVFHPDLTPDERDGFFRSFTLRAEADWLAPLARQRYVRGKAPMEIDVQYRGAALARPGVHSARVIAALDGGDLSGAAAQEFALWNTIVVADPFGPEVGHSRVYEGRALAPSTVRRHLVAAPAGATAMRVRLEVSDRIGAGAGARVTSEIVDPDGFVRGGFPGYASVKGSPVIDQVVLPPDLKPGIWEICAISPIGAMDPSPYRLAVSFDGYEASPAVITTLPRGAPGKPAETELTVTRAFDGVFKGAIEARLAGFRRERPITIEEEDVWTHSFTLDRATPSVEFRLRMDKATANLLTDCAVNVVDDTGKRVRSGAFDGVEAEMAFALPAGLDKAGYKLEVVAGFALRQDMETWGFTLDERYLLAAPVAGAVERAAGKGGPAATHLHAGVPVRLKVSFADVWPVAPDGLAPFGHVRFRDQNTSDKAPGDREGRVVLEVPIRL